MNPELFLPQRGDATPPAVIAACARCPVRAECLAWAIDHKEVGWWGGTSDTQRRIMRERGLTEPPPRVDNSTPTLIMRELAEVGDRPLSIVELSRRIGRTYDTTRQAAMALRRRGLVTSFKRDRFSHYELARVPADAEVGV